MWLINKNRFIPGRITQWYTSIAHLLDGYALRSVARQIQSTKGDIGSAIIADIIAVNKQSVWRKNLWWKVALQKVGISLHSSTEVLKVNGILIYSQPWIDPNVHMQTFQVEATYVSVPYAFYQLKNKAVQARHSFYWVSVI